MRNVILAAATLLTAGLLCSCGNDSESKSKLTALERKCDTIESKNAELSARVEKLESLQLKSLAEDLADVQKKLSLLPNTDELNNLMQRVQEAVGRMGANNPGGRFNPQDRTAREAEELKKAGLNEKDVDKVIAIRNEAREKERNETRDNPANHDAIEKKYEDEANAKIKEAVGEEGLKKVKAAEEERQNQRAKPMADAVGIDIPTARKIAAIEEKARREAFAAGGAAVRGGGADFRDLMTKARQNAEKEIKTVLGNDEAKFKAYQNYREQNNPFNMGRGNRGGRQRDNRGGEARPPADGGAAPRGGEVPNDGRPGEVF